MKLIKLFTGIIILCISSRSLSAKICKESRFSLLECYIYYCIGPESEKKWWTMGPYSAEILKLECKRGNIFLGTTFLKWGGIETAGYPPLFPVWVVIFPLQLSFEKQDKQKIFSTSVEILWSKARMYEISRFYIDRISISITHRWIFGKKPFAKIGPRLQYSCVFPDPFDDKKEFENWFLIGIEWTFPVWRW